MIVLFWNWNIIVIVMLYKFVDIGKMKNDEDLFMVGLLIWYVLIFVIVVIFFFGIVKFKNLGKDVGGVVKDFKKLICDEEVEVV